jgi:hypothetical protein
MHTSAHHRDALVAKKDVDPQKGFCRANANFTKHTMPFCGRHGKAGGDASFCTVCGEPTGAPAATRAPAAKTKTKPKPKPEPKVIPKPKGVQKKKKGAATRKREVNKELERVLGGATVEFR